MEKSRGSELDGVAQETEVQVGVEVGFQLTSILTGHPQLGGGVIVKCLALGLRQLGTDADIMLGYL